MKTKTLVAAFAASITFLTHAQEANTNGMTNIVYCVPTNISPVIVQNELVLSSQQIAETQIRQATLAQLEAANTNLPTLDDSNLIEAKQIMLLKVRGTSDLNKLNGLIASLPPPTVRTNAP